MPRLGLIVPSSNTTMEREFSVLSPQGFSVHTARLRLRKVTVKELSKMEREIEAEALKLADAEVEVIGYGCTSGSLFKGLGHDETIEARIEKITNTPAVATAGAVTSALKALDIEKVAVATPYTKEINTLESQFLLSNGFQVVAIRGVGIEDNLEIGRLDSQVAYELTMALRHIEADGVFISCTNFPTLDKIKVLEDALRRPVITSNTATFWIMLRKLGFSLQIRGFGALLERA